MISNSNIFCDVKKKKRSITQGRKKMETLAESLNGSEFQFTFSFKGMSVGFIFLKGFSDS